MKSTLFSSAFVFAATLCALPAFGQSSSELMQDGLNAAIEIASAEKASLSQACERLRDVSLKIDTLLRQHPQLAGIGKQLDMLEERYCETPGNTSPNGGITPFNDIAAALPGTIWREEPSCRNDYGPTPYCTFHHENGRGLFTLGQKGVNSFPNYLLCAMAAGSGSSVFESDYVITSRCLVSNIDWRAPGGPSDVRGLFQWLQEPAERTPIEQPIALAQQCKIAFADAAFCSPTMVVLPTRNANIVDICALHTHRSEVNAIVFRVAHGTSRWTCETKDLRIVDRQERLSVHEWDCVPTMWGNISSRCTLPYLPTVRGEVRSREMHDNNTPFNP